MEDEGVEVTAVDGWMGCWSGWMSAVDGWMDGWSRCMNGMAGTGGVGMDAW